MTTGTLIRAHFRSPALQTPPKFHARTPKREKKEKNCGGRGKKKARNFGHPTLRGPTLRGPTFSGFGPHNSGPHFFQVFDISVHSDPCFFCPVCQFLLCPNVFFFFVPFVTFILSRQPVAYFVPFPFFLSRGFFFCPNTHELGCL